MTTNFDSRSPLIVLRMKDVLARTGLSKSTVYDMSNPKSSNFDPDFPRRFQITAGGVVGWVEQELDEWLVSRLEASRSGISSR